MKRVALALSMAGLAAACTVPARNMDRVQAGMSRDQVAVHHRPAPGRRLFARQGVRLLSCCSRTSGAACRGRVSERYYVCYDEGKVESFGKVDAPTSG